MTTAQINTLVLRYEAALEAEARSTGEPWMIAVVERVAQKHKCSFAVALELMHAMAKYG